MELVLAKMETHFEDPIQYFLPAPNSKLALQPFLGKEIQFQFTGIIFCSLCQKKIPRLLERVFALVVFQRLQQLALVFCGPSFAKHILASVEIRFMKKKTITNHI